MSTAAAATTKSNVCSMYRRLLKSTKPMVGKQKTDAVKLIKSEFRTNKTESDPERIKKMLEKASSSLSYMKIVSPRSGSEQVGKVSIKFGDAKYEGRAHTNWTGKNMDPDSVARHKHTLNRAGFVNNSHAKGIF